MNLYGFASGDPVNFTDPFGLYPEMNCRPIKSTGNLALHCGIRIVNDALGISGIYELTRANNTNRFFMNRDHGLFDASGWARIEKPDGMSEDEFDSAILSAYKKEAKRLGGTKYDAGACSNSNHFAQTVVSDAGGKVPNGVDDKPGAALGAPGLRTNCPPPPR